MKDSNTLIPVITETELPRLQTNVVHVLESVLPMNMLLDYWNITSQQPKFQLAVNRLRGEMLKSGAIARAATMKALSDNACLIGQRLNDQELSTGALSTLLNQTYQISGMKGEDSRRRDDTWQPSLTADRLEKAKALQLEHPNEVPASIQERAYTSPIWYTP
jgi:hypothetical protein